MVKPIDPACTQSLQDNGGTLTTYYDTSREVVVMEATLPDGSYAGWGWGSSMTNTEMLIFRQTEHKVQPRLTIVQLRKSQTRNRL